MPNIIEFDRVALLYPGETKPALRDVTFSVAQGEFVCLIGASGCGKTTILKIISGLEEQTSGTVKKPGSVAMAFQLGALFPWLTVFENAALGLRQRGASESEIERIVEKNLRAMNMHACAQKYPADLSGGQRQRVGIARALAVDPEVLLLDEPCSALDPVTTAKIEELMFQLKDSCTMVIVTHNMQQAARASDYTAFMLDGKLIEHSETSKLFTTPTDPRTEAYITGRFG